MFRAIALTILVTIVASCGKDEPQEVFYDNTFPAISQQTPVAFQSYNKDFPINITGAVTDNALDKLYIYVIDSLTHDTIYNFSPVVAGKTGYAYNEQYYNPSDSGYKRIQVVAIDTAHHLSQSGQTYRVY